MQRMFWLMVSLYCINWSLHKFKAPQPFPTLKCRKHALTKRAKILIAGAGGGTISFLSAGTAGGTGSAARCSGISSVSTSLGGATGVALHHRPRHPRASSAVSNTTSTTSSLHHGVLAITCMLSLSRRPHLLHDLHRQEEQLLSYPCHPMLHDLPVKLLPKS